MKTLIEQLKELYKHWCEREDNSPMGSIESLDARGRNRGIKDCIDIVKQHSDWVPYSEQLPEPKTYVLVFFGGKYIEIAFYTEGLFAFDETLQMFKELDKPIPQFSVVGCKVNNPTHWMTLPQPPSEVSHATDN